MVKTIAEVYELDINLVAHETKYPVDRRLRTIKNLNGLITPRPFSEMILELKEWEEVEYERVPF
jgi:hypothetical protein